MTEERKMPELPRELSDELIIAIAKGIFGCCDICLSGRGERDREVTVEEYPIGEDAIAFARVIQREAWNAALEAAAEKAENTEGGDGSHDYNAGSETMQERIVAAIRSLRKE